MTEQEVLSLRLGDKIEAMSEPGTLEIVSISDKRVAYHILIDYTGSHMDAYTRSLVFTHPANAFKDYRKVVTIEGFEL